MRQFCIVLTAVCFSFTLASRAQDTITNALKTEIENFEAQTGTVIVKGFGEIGSVTASAGVISVRCKESANVSTGQKEYGIAFAFGNNRLREFAVVDYDEIDSLLNGMDYLSKITPDATMMPEFEAIYSTKSGLRIVAYSAGRQGGIQDFLQFSDAPRILLASDQMVQLRNLIAQAKTSLDALKNKNSLP
ncbi:MAG: hypothetical protein ACREFE_05810 [Limisphaerales bacterium]